MDNPLEEIRDPDLKLIVLEMRNIKESVEKIDQKIDDHLVTKDQMKLHTTEQFAHLHQHVLDPMQSKLDAADTKATWALRFVIGVMTAICMGVLGAVLKNSINISL
jgi:hypothetical protein